MAPDDPADDPDLRARVAELEATVEQHQATIEQLLPSRRRVLQAGGLVAGGGVLGALSADRASADVTGQVGTSQDRVDVFAGDVDANTLDVTNETLILAKSDATVGNFTSGDFNSPSFGNVITDVKGEFANDGFTPDETGWYQINAVAQAGATAANDGDRLQAGLLENGSFLYSTTTEYFSDNEDFFGYPPVNGVFKLTTGNKYQYKVTNKDTSYNINGNGARITVTSIFR